MKTTPIYDGKIKARNASGMVRLGQNFQVIYPGYDSQGRRRQSWTQVVWKGIPIWETKLACTLSAAIAKFDSEMAKHVGKDTDLLVKALNQAAEHRRKRFQDGVTGEAPAPTLTADSRSAKGVGINYVT